MRENQFLSILALIMALGMPFSFELFVCVVVAAEGKIFDAEVRTETELFMALGDPNILQIALKNDIVTTRNLEVSRNLILELNGFNLTSLKANVSVIDVKYGSFLLTGKGSVVAYGLKGTAVRVKGATTSDNENYAEVCIDKAVKLFAPNYYGLMVAPNFKSAYGVTVDFYGTMVAQDGFYIHHSIHGRGKNIPLIRIADQTKITVDENSGVAIHSAGHGRWEIGASEITGATGIIAQSGNITLNNTKIIATGAYVEVKSDGDNLTTMGAVLQSGKALGDEYSAEVTINSGEYTSLRSYLFAETCSHDVQPALQMLVIEGGDFAGKLGTFSGLAPRNAEHAITVIYGGNFTENVQDFIASSCHINKLPGQGIYQVIEDKVATEVDEATRLARAEGQLQALIEKALPYTTNYASGDLGRWKPAASKAIASIKRAITLGKKALKQHLEYERIVSAEQSLQRALDNIELVSDAMRTELAESIASVNAIDPQDYTKYSYRQLAMVSTSAEELLQHEQIPLKDLYSAILDVEINIDLLDGIDEISEEELLEEFSDVDETIEIDSAAKDNEVIEEIIETTETNENTGVIADIDTIDTDEITQVSEFIASLFLTQAPAFFDFDLESTGSMESTEPASLNAPILAEPPAPAIPPLPTNAFMSSPAPSPSRSSAPAQPDATYILSHSVDFPVETALLEAKGNLYSMLDAVHDLTINDYEVDYAEQFGGLQVAIARARAILYKPSATFVELMSVMDDLTASTAGLKGIAEVEEAPVTASASASSPDLDSDPDIISPTTLEQAVQVDWTGLREVVAEVSRLNPDDFTAVSYARVLAQLERAKAMLASPDATQSAVEDLVFEINLAMLALERIPQVYDTPVTSTEPANETVAAVYTPPVAEQDPTVSPSWFMSMLAGAYAGLATYRRSRLLAKQQKHSTL